MKKRVAWLDVLRVAAAFLVIVNHTNSSIFQSATPANGSWWASMLWYYISKTAVPIFVMVSGACLLPRREGYRKNGARIVRMLLVLVLFSYLFFLYDAWMQGALWPRAVDAGAFASRLWTARCGDAYWYLYFYIGLLLMLPLLQRMAAGMSKGDSLYLMGLCFGLDAVWPLVTHYLPALRLSGYFFVPLFSAYLGLFFAGDFLRQSGPVSRRQMLRALAVLLGSLALSVGLTRVEYGLGTPKYWFMDDRMHPSATTVAAAISMAVLARGLCGDGNSPRALSVAAGCSFGIYLFEEMMIDLTEAPVYLPLCSHMPAVAAVVLWELAVFAICFGLTLIAKRIPGLKRLL